MKKTLFLVFLLLFQFVGSAQFLRTPYPIIFVHGISGEYTIWDSITTHLSNNFGPTQVVNVVLNAAFDTTHYLDDVIIEFEGVSPLPNVNFFAVNFKNWWNRDRTHPSVRPGETHNNPLESRSNESAIFKQGYALKLVIQKVLNATNADGVILVGHSMGGLAIREYLQRNDDQGSRMWWIDKNDTIAGHRVKKVLTLNTPHLGANILELPTVQNSPDPLTFYSEAARDLIESYKALGAGTYPGVYLFGGDEKKINIYSTFHNYDVNCNGKTTDTIIGISQDSSFNPNMSLPTNIYYTWGTSSLFEWPPPLVGDLVVKTEHMWLRDQQGVVMPEGADTIFTNATHINVYNQLEHLLRGLDEPNSEELAYDFTPKDSNYVRLDREIGGFITQPAQLTISPDYDYYKIKIPAPGDLKVRLFSYLSGVKELAVFSGNNTVSTNSIPGEILLHADTGMHYIRIKGNPEFYTWSFPYTLSVKYDLGTPPQFPTNLLPLNGAIFVHQNMSVDWSDVDRAKTYEFQLAKDSLFSNLVYSQTGLTSSTIDVSNLELEKKYYWRVRSVNYWGTSEWSSVWSFTTEDAIAVGKVNSTPSGGFWGDTDTWIDCKVPSENEDVVIRGPVTLDTGRSCRNMIILSEGLVLSGNQQISTLRIKGDLVNRGVLGCYYTYIAGDLKNYGSIINGRIYLNGISEQYLYLGEGKFFDCDISCTNPTGDLIAGTELRFSRTIDLNGKRLITGDFIVNGIEGADIRDGRIEQDIFRFQGGGSFINMQLNVRNLYMRGRLWGCNLQGPVTFYDRTQIFERDTVNGILTIADTLENSSGINDKLHIIGDFFNNGVISPNPNLYNSYLSISMTGNLTNNGLLSCNATVEGNLVNNAEITYGSISVLGDVFQNGGEFICGLILNGIHNQFLYSGQGKSFDCNISCTNPTGDLIAGTELRFSRTIDLNGKRLITGDFIVNGIEGADIRDGRIEQDIFRFQGGGSFINMQLNVRNLYMRGRLWGCNLQGPVTFYGRTQIDMENIIDGDLTVGDSLESTGGFLDSFEKILRVNGNLHNNGTIRDNSSYLRINLTGNLNDYGEIKNNAIYLVGDQYRTIRVGENCSSNFISVGDSVILTGLNRLPNLSVTAGKCILRENSELIIFGNKIQGNFENFGKVILWRPNYNTTAVYDFFMANIKLGIQPNFNKLIAANFGHQTPAMFGTAIKCYWSISTEPISYFDAQFISFDYKDDMLNGNDESRLEVFHSNDGQNNWQKVSSPSNISRNPEMNSVQISNIPIQGYFTLASSANFPEIVVLSLPQNDQPNEPIPVKLVWRKANMAGRYMLSVAKDSLFSQIVVADSNLTDTVRILSNMDYNSSYYWRVKAGNQLGWGDWSSTRKFTTIIEKPATPVLATPLNNSLGLLNPIAVNWNKSLRVEKYRLQISADSLFGSFVVNDSTLSDTSKMLPNLSNYMKYYWRVKARNIGGESEWSNIWNFKTLGNPYASNPVTPYDASLHQPLNGLVFKWTRANERIETIQKYQFQISTDSLFGSFFLNDTTITDTSRIVNGLSYLTKYFWRVRAKNQTGWGDWSSTWRFTTIIEKPSIPMLTTPLNNSKGLLNPITVKWNISLRVEKYKLQVSTDSLFGSLLVNDSTLTDTTKLLPDLANFIQYYWRVKAVNIGGESNWSPVWNFKTLGNPYASNLIEPSNNLVNLPLNGVTFKWTKAKERIETVLKYQLQISTDSLFASFGINDTTLTDTVRIVNGLSYLTKYYWRVRAMNETGWGDWSGTWKFTTIIEKPPVPIMASPANNTLGLLDPVTFKWSKSERAEKYAIQLSRTEAFDQVFFSGETFDTTKIYSSTIAPLLPNTRYYWRVRATNTGGTSDWTSGWSFKMLGNPYASTLLQPADQAVNQPTNGLTFKWTKAMERIEAIQKYQLQISTDSLFASFVVNDTTLTDTLKIVNGLNYLTRYYWRVRAKNETGWGDWSLISRFTTIIERPTVPVLATPANGSLGLISPVSVIWKKALRVETYRLQVSTDSLFGSFIVDQQNLVDTSKVLPVLSNYTKYFWRVKAVNVGGESNWSIAFSFKTLGNPYASTPVQPADLAVNQPLNGLTFKWTKANERIEAIQKYQLQISTDSLFGSFIVNDTTLTDTTRNVNGLSYLTKYFWRVRAKNETGWGAWSVVSRFTSIIEKPATPVLANPLNDALGLLNPIFANWNKAPRTEKYHVQVSTDNLFTTFVVNDSTIADTAKMLPNLSSYTKYYWRIRAVNVGGISDWSTIWNFRTLGNPYASNLVEPLNNSVNLPLNGVVFKWTKAKERIETIQKYQIQVSTDSLFGTLFINDSTLTDTSRIVNGMSYLTKYFWRVRAKNETGWGDWSGTWRFTTIIEKPTTPQLAAPLDNAVGLINPVTAKWNKSLRAEKYHLQIATDNLFTTLTVNDSTVTDTSKVLPDLSNYTQYFWRVKAINIGGNSEWSAAWDFKTLGNPYSSNLIQPIDNSNNNPASGLVFKWRKANERIESIQKYHFQVSIDSLFGTLFINDSTLTDTSRIVNGMGYLTKYYWRVRAQNETGWGDWSAFWRFTTIIEKPATPLLASPANGSLGLLNPVSVIWQKALRAETYRLQVSADSSFNSLIVDQQSLTDTIKVLPALANYTEYYWRVKAHNIGGASDWSTVWNFKTLGTPYSVQLASPSNGAINHPVNSVTFKWYRPQERTETILKYHFQLAYDSLFTNIAFYDSTYMLDTATTGSGLSFLTTYYWRVRAKNQTGWGDWSDVWHLTTIIEKPAVPLLAAPANNSTLQLQPVTLKWRPALRASIYTLEVSDDPAFGTLIISDSTIIDTLRVLPQLDAPKTYYWRVKARNIGGVSEFSETWSFRTLGLPLAVNLVSPLNGAVDLPVNNVLFKWSSGGEQTFASVSMIGEPKEAKATGASTKPAGKAGISSHISPLNSLSGNPETIGKYWLEITTDTSGSTMFLSDSTLADTTRLVSGLNHLTTYYWRVKAQNEVGWGRFSGWFRFTTIIERPGAVTLFSPQDQTTGLVQPITVKWRTAPRAEKYTLEVSETAGFTSFVVRDTNLTDTTRLLPALSQLRQYYWRVYASNSGGVGDTSTVWRFKTLGAPTTVDLIYPSNNAVNIPVDPTFIWTRATDQEAILGYWFELHTDTTALPLIRDTLLTDTSKAVSGLANNTAFFWRVKAKNETGWGDFTAWGRFKTVKRLIAPPSGLAATAVAVGQVRLEWTDNSDNESGFVIARKTGDSTSPGPLVVLDSIGAGVTQYLDSLVSDTTFYSYVVVAYNNDTISLPSNYAQVFTLTGIEELFADQLPHKFDLYQNYPNPFNPSTMIRFAIPEESRVRIELYSMQGELITVLMSEEMTAGYYETRLEIPNYASGIYLYRIVAQPVDGSEPFTNTKKLILVK